MNEQTWIDPRCDRSEWGPGEWDGEPDKAQWKDEATGLICLAKRHPKYGHWCGYVGVDPSHPWHGKAYSDDGVNAEVHGGLTFANSCQEGPPEQSICHVPTPGEPEHLWWLGFDCSHAWDCSPYNVIQSRRGYPFTIHADEVYRTLEYVKGECVRLAYQVHSAASKEGKQ